MEWKLQATFHCGCRLSNFSVWLTQSISSYTKIKSTQRLVFRDIFGAHSVQFNNKNISWVFHMLPGVITAIVISAVVNSQKRTPNISASAKKLIKFVQKLIEYSFFVKFAARDWGFMFGYCCLFMKFWTLFIITFCI